MVRVPVLLFAVAAHVVAEQDHARGADSIATYRLKPAVTALHDPACAYSPRPGLELTRFSRYSATAERLAVQNSASQMRRALSWCLIHQSLSHPYRTSHHGAIWAVVRGDYRRSACSLPSWRLFAGAFLAASVLFRFGCGDARIRSHQPATGYCCAVFSREAGAASDTDDGCPATVRRRVCLVLGWRGHFVRRRRSRLHFLREAFRDQLRCLRIGAVVDGALFDVVVFVQCLDSASPFFFGGRPKAAPHVTVDRPVYAVAPGPVDSPAGP